MSEKITSLKSGEITQVYRKGKSKANKYLILYVQPDVSGGIGISVSKKVGNSVVRHRVKRLVKEAYRLNRHHVTDRCRLVVVARNTAKGRSYKELESALMHLCKIHGIYLK